MRLSLASDKPWPGGFGGNAEIEAGAAADGVERRSDLERLVDSSREFALIHRCQCLCG